MAHTLAGTVTDVLHSRVYADGRYVGAPPVDIPTGGRLCTDVKGEAGFNLAKSGKTTKCFLLPSSTVQAPSPRPAAVFNVESGTTWCALQPSDGTFAAPSTRGTRIVARKTTTTTLVGVVVDVSSTTIKVWTGSVTVTAGTGTKVVGSRQQVRSTARAFGPVTPAMLTADERIAVAKLQLPSR